MREPVVLAGGGDTIKGRGVLALVLSDDDDDAVLAMYGSDVDHEHEDPPFSIVVTDEELLAAGSKMVRLAQERIKKAKREGEGGVGSTN